MLKIMIEGVSMDYPENMSLTYTIENPMFSDDRSVPVPFTNTIELSATEKNLRALGHPHRPGVAGDPFAERVCELIMDGVVVTGVFTINSVTEDMIEGEFTESDILNATRTKSHSANLERTYVGTTPVNYDSQAFKDKNRPVEPNDRMLSNIYLQIRDAVIGQNVEGDGPFVFAPIRNLDGDFLEENYSQFDNVRRMFINPYMPLAQGFAFKNNIIAYYCMGSIQPGVRFGYLLDRLMNGRIDNNVFNEGELRKVVLQLLYHPSLKENAVGFPHTEKEPGPDGWLRYFDPAAMMPDIPRIDIVREVLKIFCITMFPDSGRFELAYNKDVLADPEVIDLDGFHPRIVSVGRERGRFYDYGYSGQEYPEVGLYQLATTPESVWKKHANGSEGLYWAMDHNQYIELKETSNYTQKWDMEIVVDGWRDAENEPAVPEDREVHDMVSDITPLNNSYHNIWAGTIYSSQPPDEGPSVNYSSLHIPETKGYAGSQDYPRIMLYHGYQRFAAELNAVYTQQYPYLSGKNKGPDGTKLSDLTLEFDVPDVGLYDRYHKPWAVYIERGKATAEIEIPMNARVLSLIRRMRKKFKICNKVWYIRQADIEYNGDHLGIGTLDVIEV